MPAQHANSHLNTYGILWQKDGVAGAERRLDRGGLRKRAARPPRLGYGQLWCLNLNGRRLRLARLTARGEGGLGELLKRRVQIEPWAAETTKKAGRDRDQRMSRNRSGLASFHPIVYGSAAGHRLPRASAIVNSNA